MIDTPQIIPILAQPIALVHLKIPRSDAMKVMGPSLMEVKKAVAKQNVAQAGPWFTHHLRMEPGTFDFEICVPVASSIQPDGRVQPGEWPAMTVARTVHRGPFEKLGQAWGEFDAWLKSNNHATAEDLYEVYLVGPESGPDSSNYQTQLNRPIRSA